MKAITGLQGWAGGDVEYMGKSIKGVPSYVLLKQGLAMVPEARVFARMTITENLQMGAYTRNDEAGIKADVDRMFGIFPRLKERANQLAGPCPAASSNAVDARALIEAAQGAAAGRALDGSVADHGREDLRVVRDISSQA